MPLKPQPATLTCPEHHIEYLATQHCPTCATRHLGDLGVYAHDAKFQRDYDLAIAIHRTGTRERIATAVLAALFTHNSVVPQLNLRVSAIAAIQAADALIAELDKEPKP